MSRVLLYMTMNIMQHGNCIYFVYFPVHQNPGILCLAESIPGICFFSYETDRQIGFLFFFLRLDVIQLLLYVRK